MNLTKVLLAWVRGTWLESALCLLHASRSWLIQIFGLSYLFSLHICRMTYFHCQLFSFFVLLQFPYWLFGFSAAWALLIAVGFISYITKSILIISTMGTHDWKNFHKLFTSLEKRKLYRVETKRLGFALMRVFIHGSLAFVIPWEILGVPYEFT